MPIYFDFLAFKDEKLFHLLEVWFSTNNLGNSREESGSLISLHTENTIVSPCILQCSVQVHQ